MEVSLHGVDGRIGKWTAHFLVPQSCPPTQLVMGWNHHLGLVCKTLKILHLASLGAAVYIGLVYDVVSVVLAR